MRKEFKHEMLIRRTREIILQYNFKLTIRQVYYRLVSAQDIENNISQYNYFDKKLTEARKKDFDLAEYFEDKTRTLTGDINVDSKVPNFFNIIENRFNDIRTICPKIEYSGNNLQEKITIILLEKQALESVFLEILENKFGFILVVARGFNSFTQMYNLSKAIKNETREIHLCTFADYDDSGNLIKENFIKQCTDIFNIKFESIRDISLTDEQIIENDLPRNPTQKKGKGESTHRKYQLNREKALEYYVELDALEPHILQDLIENEVDKNFDMDLYNSINRALNIRNRRLKKTYFKKLRKLDLSYVKDGR